MSISKYELLLERHLSLLEVLRDNGIKVTREDGKWAVVDKHATLDIPDAPPVAKRVRFDPHATPIYSNQCHVDFGGKRATGYVIDDPADDWSLRVKLHGNTLLASFNGVGYERVQYTEEMWHLLHALRAAIVAAPAKA